MVPLRSGRLAGSICFTQELMEEDLRLEEVFGSLRGIGLLQGPLEGSAGVERGTETLGGKKGDMTPWFLDEDNSWGG